MITRCFAVAFTFRCLRATLGLWPDHKTVNHKLCVSCTSTMCSGCLVDGIIWLLRPDMVAAPLAILWGTLLRAY
ncbi:hypothetical protein BDR05DRAFT_964549 [Suillus weaverae]|nr:hypothetical protein BDR05DRAFT_964549 [Suillus weaverae]